MTDPTSTPDDQPTDDSAAAGAPNFSAEPQPGLPLAERRTKAGISRNRIGLWIIGAAFALYLIITGIVGILTKAR